MIPKGVIDAVKKFREENKTPPPSATLTTKARGQSNPTLDAIKDAGMRALQGVSTTLDAIPPSVDLYPGPVDNVAVMGLAGLNKGIKTLVKGERGMDEVVGAVNAVRALKPLTKIDDVASKIKDATKLSINKLIALNSEGFDNAISNIAKGQPSVTKGPIDVLKTGEGYLIVDGNHRVVQSMQKGLKDIDANILSKEQAIAKHPEYEIAIESALDASPSTAKLPTQPTYYRATTDGQTLGSGQKWAWTDKASAESWAKRNNAKVVEFTVPDSAIDPIDLSRMKQGTTDRFMFDTSKANTLPKLPTQTGETLYHSGAPNIKEVNLNKSRFDKTFYMSENPEYAKSFGGPKAQLNEMVLDPKAKLADMRKPSSELVSQIEKALVGEKTGKTIKLQRPDGTFLEVPEMKGKNSNAVYSNQAIIQGIKDGKAMYAELPEVKAVLRKLGYDGQITTESKFGSNYGVWNKDIVKPKSLPTQVEGLTFYHGTSPENAKSLVANGFNPKLSDKVNPESPYALFASEYKGKGNDHMAGTYGKSIVEIKPKGNVKIGDEQVWTESLGKAKSREDSAMYAQQLRERGYDAVRVGNGEIVVLAPEKFSFNQSKGVQNDIPVYRGQPSKEFTMEGKSAGIGKSFTTDRKIAEVYGYKGNLIEGSVANEDVLRYNNLDTSTKKYIKSIIDERIGGVKKGLENDNNKPFEELVLELGEIARINNKKAIDISSFGIPSESEIRLLSGDALKTNAAMKNKGAIGAVRAVEAIRKIPQK